MGRPENRKAYRERHPERDKQARRDAKARWIARNPEKYAEENRARMMRHRKQFPDEVRARERAQYQTYKRQRRSYILQSKFGITADQWDVLFESQGYRCACCKASEPGSLKGWQTDHCHFTGRIRGILCQPCNHSLTEHFQKNADKLVAYLRLHSELLA